jgi:hypothetical protein
VLGGLVTIILELDDSGRLKLYQDAGQTVQVELRWGDRDQLRPVASQALPSNVLHHVGQVRYDLHQRSYRLEVP